MRAAALRLAQGGRPLLRVLSSHCRSQSGSWWRGSLFILARDTRANPNSSSSSLNRASSSYGTKTPHLSPLATELLLARRRESHARESRSAEWREALGRVRRAACGGGEDDEAEDDEQQFGGQWQAAAAALQRAALQSPLHLDRLFNGDAASDAAELRALLALMCRGGKEKKEGGGERRAAAALLPALAAAPAVVLAEGGARGAAEVLAVLRTRAGLTPVQALEAVERCPGLLGFAPARVRDNLLWLAGATGMGAASSAAEASPSPPPPPPPLLSVLALGAPAALGRDPADLRATWEFLVAGGPAFAPEADLRRWPAALDKGAAELKGRWEQARRLGVRLVRPSEEEDQEGGEGASSSSSSSWRQRGAERGGRG